MWKRVELVFILIALLFLGALHFISGLNMTGFSVLGDRNLSVDNSEFFLVALLMASGAAALFVLRFLHDSYKRTKKIGSGRNRISVQRKLLKFKV